VFYIVSVPIWFAKKLWVFIDDDFTASFILIVLIYMFNSIFEQQAPFGPGAKNFLLWVVLGFVIKHSNSYLKEVVGVNKIVAS
jgi:hypothetical protein